MAHDELGAPRLAAARELPASYAVPRRSGDHARLRSRGPAPRRWTEAEALEAIRRWARAYGAPPTTIDWDASRAVRMGQPWRAERFHAGQWPSARVVTRLFGTFNAAVEQAGERPRTAPVRSGAQVAGPGAVLDAIREWVRRYGDVPTMADWNPARARRIGQDWRIARFYDGDWPNVRTVSHHFGSLAAAVAAAGLTPRAASSQHRDRSDEQAANRRAVAERLAAGLELPEALRRLDDARRSEDPCAIHAALLDLAGSALAEARLAGVAES